MSYTEKEQALLRLLVERRGVQLIIDTASQLFENPVFLCDLGYKIIAHSTKGAKPDAFWLQLQTATYSLPEQIAEIMRSGDFARVYATDEPKVGKYSFTDAPYLAARVRDGAHVLGHICIYGCGRTFTQEDNELLILLCKVVSYEMMYRGISQLYQVPYYTLFSDLLSGALASQTELDARLRSLNLPLPEQIQVAVVRFKEGPGEISVYYLREFLMHNLVRALSIVYEGQLVFLVPAAYVTEGTIEKNLMSYQHNIALQIGVSHEVENLLHLRSYYLQACQAIRFMPLLGIEKQLCRYGEIMVYDLLATAGQQNDLLSFCDPVLISMQESDKNNHTEDVQNLRHFLEAGKDVGRAAKMACVHKNSMYYRVDRLRERYGIDFENEEVCLSLRLSLKLLELSGFGGGHDGSSGAL